MIIYTIYKQETDSFTEFAKLEFADDSACREYLNTLKDHVYNATRFNGACFTQINQDPQC